MNSTSPKKRRVQEEDAEKTHTDNMADKVPCYACFGAKIPLQKWEFDQRPFDEEDIDIEITHSGVCHSDVHNVDGDWGDMPWPLVPGHEILGIVKRVGSKVTKFKVGDRAGVGPQALSCRKCENCLSGHENYCVQGMTETYGHVYPNSNGFVTKGGYARYHRVNSHYAVPIPAELPSDATAPLLCAGITVYTPLKYLNVGKGNRVGIVGVGGLGHLGIKFAAAFGAEVTAISTSPHKEADAKSFGATKFLVTSNKEQVKEFKHYFDVILNTASGDVNYNELFDMLKNRGHLSTVGAPPCEIHFDVFKILTRGLNLHSTLIGSPSEQAEMLELCAKHNILPRIETMHWSKVNDAMEKVRSNKANFRVVLLVDDSHA